MELMKANANWRTRPDDERFTSLFDMRDSLVELRNRSRQMTISNRDISLMPDPDNEVGGMLIQSKDGGIARPTHFAFGKLAQLGGAPGGYLRGLPAPIAADCLNYSLHYDRGPEDMGILLTRDSDNRDSIAMRTATGAAYGRIWNSAVVSESCDRFGDGVTGQWRVPGEFGKAVAITKANTTLYAGERDCFIFLADEDNRIEIPNRRDGKSGSMARGFFLWNSEVGDNTIGAAFFLFDYVCCNRIVWGVGEYSESKIRHTKSAPAKWIEKVSPVLDRLSDLRNSSQALFVDPIKAAMDKRVEDVNAFLKTRFAANAKLSTKTIDAIAAAHLADEGRPMESLWDISTGITAFARTLPNQDTRIALEREAGKVIALAQ